MVLVRKLRACFRHEWTWRLFCVLASLGLIGVVVLDASKEGWSLAIRTDTRYELTEEGRKVRAEAARRCRDTQQERLARSLYREASFAPPARLTAAERVKTPCQHTGVLAPGFMLLERFYVKQSFLRWGPLERAHWQLSSETPGSATNWILLLLLAGPFAFAKAADWIASGRRQGVLPGLASLEAEMKEAALDVLGPGARLKAGLIAGRATRSLKRRGWEGLTAEEASDAQPVGRALARPAGSSR